MGDIKQSLKDARDAIDKKDFEEAIKLIKSVLKRDKNNYMALVLLGVALENSEQAPLAFKKAISICKEKVLAWQGLASYYEKTNFINNYKELINVYVQLLSIETDINKCEDLCSRFFNIALQINDNDSVILLYEQFSNSSDLQKKPLVYLTLARVLSHITFTKTEEFLSLFQNIYDTVVEYDLQCTDFIIKYCEYLQISNGFSCMLEQCKKYINRNVSRALIEWICEQFNSEMLIKESVETGSLVYIEELANHLPDCCIKTFTFSLIFYLKMDYLNSYHLLKNLLSYKNEDLKSVLLAMNCLKLQRWIEAESLSCMLITNNNTLLSQKGVKMLMVALSHQDNDVKSHKAIELENLLETSNVGKDEYIALFMACIQINDLIKAEKYLSFMKLFPEYYSMYGLFLKKSGNILESFNILDQNKESAPHCWYQLALHYWEQKDFEQMLLPLLRAAKIEKNNFSVFLLLGDYYSIIDENLDKANKCYLKAFTLNPESSQAGKSLSSTYRKLHNWVANYALLKSLSNMKTTKDSWVWLQLGLHHLALEQWDEAIINLRTYMRFNPNDVEAWESLADAYYSRGSFTSALKCYKKAISLNSNTRYSLVQVGAVQCLLGDYTEALLTYKSFDYELFLPALKGMADVYLSIANEKLSQNLFGGCRDNAQETITLMSKAILNGNQFVCLWNTLATAIATIAKLPIKYRWLEISHKICNFVDSDLETIVISNETVFDLAIRCLCRALHLSTSLNSFIYHQLATVYLDYYVYYGHQDSVKKAYTIIRRCLKFDQNNWQYWNLLGVICTSKDIQKYAIAQHAFIKAISLEFSNAMLWSNLGLLYFNFNNYKLSNKCFTIAQQFDPSYLQSWVGQALIAESIQHEETMDLFRHSSQLGFHKESALGYSEWVCKTLMNYKNKKESKIEYSIKNMHAVPISCDLMSWLIEYEPENSGCLNVLGILQEKMGMISMAAKTFENALNYVNTENKDVVLLNYGRTLYRLGEFESAVNVYKSISEASLNSACGLGLSYYKVKQFNESYEIYGTALQWLSSNDKERAEILVAMASMAYKIHGPQQCKTHLFQSVQQCKDNPCIQGLLAIYSLGLLNSEQTLSTLVLNELHKSKDKMMYSHYLGFFESYVLYKNNHHVDAVRKLGEFIHILPNNAYLWQHLASYCLSEISWNPFIASMSAQKSIIFDKSIIDSKNIIKGLKHASIAEMYLNNFKQSRNFAQKAIHLYPNCAENWVVLICVMVTFKKKQMENINWFKNLMEYVKNSLNPNKSVDNWLDFFERHYLRTF